MTRETNSLDELFNELDTKADASVIDDVKSRIQAIEDANAQRSSVSNVSADDKKAAELQAAQELMVKGAAYIGEYKTKASEVSITVDAEGGFSIPKIIDANVTDYLRKTSPVRQFATITRQGTNYNRLIKVNGSAAALRGEKDAMPARTNDTWAQLTFGMTGLFDVQKHTVWADDSNSILNLAQELQTSIGQNIGEKEAELFIRGTVTNSLNVAGATSTVNCGLITLAQQAGADKFTNELGKLGVISAAVKNDGTDDWFSIFADLLATVHSKYRTSTGMGIILSTELETILRKTKDNYGHFQFTGVNGVAGAQPGTIWGVPYVVCDFMPTVTDAMKATGTDSGKPAALVGDFSKYVINEGGAMKWIKDPYTDSGFVKYTAHSMVGGALTDFQAVRGLKLTTAA